MPSALLFSLVAATLAAHVPLVMEPPGFDLICSVTVSEEGKDKTVTSHFSVDAVAKRWCYRDLGCGQTYAVTAMTPTTLSLLDVQTPINEAKIEIDRASGQLTERFVVPNRSSSTGAGSCHTAPYTAVAP